MKTLTSLLWFALTFSQITLANPVECYRAATNSYGVNLSRANAIRLCAGSQGVQTVECYRSATNPYGVNLDSSQAITLCSGNSGTKEVECYRSATNPYGINLNTADAVSLCRTSLVNP